MGVQRKKRQRKEIGVYVHIPFCTERCDYCDFVSHTTPALYGVNTDKGKKTLINEYFKCVEAELSACLDSIESLSNRYVTTVYFGGGTPSLVSPSSISELLYALSKRFSVANDCEVTLEANPETINEARLRGYKGAGVNRLSIGVQCFDDSLLKTLGRTHNTDDAKRAYSLARSAGFDNVGLDLIFSIPGQGLGDWESTLEESIRLAPEHLSVYALTLEGGTPMHQAAAKGELRLVAEEDEARMFLLAKELLVDAGYEHYEVSNYCKPGRRSRHNLAYWTGKDYLGLGVGAHSYLGSLGPWGTRWWNTRKFNEYIINAGQKETTLGKETLEKEEAMTEALSLGLRLIDGINIGAFRRRFGCSPSAALYRRGLIEEGLLDSNSGVLRLTKKGLLLANEVF